MPVLGGDEFFASNGCIAFNDGTHRFAWVRDHGGEAMPFMVSREDFVEIRLRLKTDARSQREALPLFWLSVQERDRSFLTTLRFQA
jgi:hypothetical protein